MWNKTQMINLIATTAFGKQTGITGTSTFLDPGAKATVDGMTLGRLLSSLFPANKTPFHLAYQRWNPGHSDNRYINARLVPRSCMPLFLKSWPSGAEKCWLQPSLFPGSQACQSVAQIFQLITLKKKKSGLDFNVMTRFDDLCNRPM